MSDAIPFARYEKAVGGTKAEVVALPWEGMRPLLTTHTPRATKEGAAWSPVIFKAGHPTLRKNENIEAITCFAADIDDGTDPKTLRSRWEGWDWCLHTSYSSTPDLVKYRVIFPLVQPVPVEQWPAVLRKLVYALTDGHSDASCKDVSRLYYLPACPFDRLGEANADFGEGAPLDPDAFPDPPPEEETQAFHNAARLSRKPIVGLSSGNRPGDDYNRRGGAGEMIALAASLGLVVKHDHGDWQEIGWRDTARDQVCGSIGVCGPNILWLWTPNTPLPVQTPLSLFAARTAIKHGSLSKKAFADCARELGDLGYGGPKRKRGEPPPPSPVAERAAAKADEHAADTIPPPSLTDESGRPDYAPSQIVHIAGRAAWGVAGLDTHAAHARRIIEHLGNDLCYCPQLGWLLFTGKRWERDDKEATRTTAKVAGLSSVVRDEAARLFGCVGALLKAGRTEHAQALERAARRHITHTKTVESSAFIAGALHQAAGLLTVPTERFDSKPYVIGFDNGVWDRGEWREHRRDDFMMRLSPVALDANVDNTEWLTVLGRITGVDAAEAEETDQKKAEARKGAADFARTLQETMGYALSGAPFLRTLPWLYGPKGTGKSTIAELLMTVLGEMAGSVDPALLSDVADRERLGVVLWGRRLVVCAEAGAQRISAEVLKTQTGGDRYPVRILYKEAFTAAPSHVLLMVANDAPNMSAYDDALRERVMALPCEHPLNKPTPLKLTGGARIEAVRTDPQSPLARGFAAWAVDGMRQVMASQTIHRAACVVAATVAFWADTDALTPFWESVAADADPEINLEMGVSATDLRNAYLRWCSSEGRAKPYSQRQFAAACRAQGLQEVRLAAGKVWKQPGPTLPGLESSVVSVVTSPVSGKLLYEEKKLHREFPKNAHVTTLTTLNGVALTADEIAREFPPIDTSDLSDPFGDEPQEETGAPATAGKVWEV